MWKAKNEEKRDNNNKTAASAGAATTLWVHFKLSTWWTDGVKCTEARRMSERFRAIFVEADFLCGIALLHKWMH